jgi:hypothetical protein
MKTKTKELDYKGFGEHLIEYEEKGIPIGMSDLIRLAKKYNTPIPIKFDEDNNPIFKDE